MTRGERREAYSWPESDDTWTFSFLFAVPGLVGPSEDLGVEAFFSDDRQQNTTDDCWRVALFKKQTLDLSAEP